MGVSDGRARQLSNRRHCRAGTSFARRLAGPKIAMAWRAGSRYAKKVLSVAGSFARILASRRDVVHTFARLNCLPPTQPAGSPILSNTGVFMKVISLAAALLLTAVYTLAQTNPVPLLNQPLVPMSTAPGGPGFTLTVNGT